MDGAIQLELGLNQTVGGSQVSTWYRRLIVQREGPVLRPDKIPDIGHLIPVSGAKNPCSPGEGISRQMPAAQGLLRFCATSRPLFVKNSLLISLIAGKNQKWEARKDLRSCWHEKTN
jgi:hypothetical protein